MDRIPIDKSSLIKSVGHSNDNAMEIELANGQVYRYDGIDRETFEAFMAADSKGQHFNRVIKNACTGCTRVEREDALGS